MDFSGRFVLSLIHFATHQKADATYLMSLTGSDYSTLCQEESRVSMEIFNSVIVEAVKQTNDPNFGLHAGEYMNLSAAGLIGQITQTAATVKEALDYCCEFASLGCRALPMTLEETDENYSLSFKPDKYWLISSKETVKQTLDGILAFTIREFHALTRNQYYPTHIHYQFDESEADEISRVMNCNVKFDQPITQLFFKKEHIDQAVVTSDYYLLRILVKYAEEKVSLLEQEKGYATKVKQTVVNLIKPQFPTIHQVASNLNSSVRTVQRRLKEEGSTYKEIVETLRKEFAFQYINQPNLSVNEIANLLSYADASAFIRSFKRWTGKTPTEYRNNSNA